MPRTLPVLWKFGKRSIPTRLPSAIVILFTLIVLKCLSSNYFPFCYALLSISGRAGRFSCKSTLRTQGSEKASVESAARPGYPNFGGTRKFVEAHGRRRRRKVEWHLTFLLSAVTSHRKTPPCRGSMLTRVN